MIEYKDKLGKINFDEKARVMKAISHPVRLRIVYALSKKSCNVKSMWQCLELPQDVVSQHLAILRKKDILKTDKKGNSVFYSINDKLDVKEIINYLK